MQVPQPFANDVSYEEAETFAKYKPFQLLLMQREVRNF